MLTPEELADIPEELRRYLQDLEDYTLWVMMNRIAMAAEQAEKNPDTAVLLGFGKEAEAEVSSALSLVPAIAAYLLHSSATKSVAADRAAAGAAATGLLSPDLMGILREAQAQLAFGTGNIARSAGFGVMRNGNLVFEGVAKAYAQELNRAVMRVRSGLADPRTAVRDAVKSLAGGGLQWVDYASGYRSRLDVALTRAVRTGVSQMAQQMTLSQMEKSGWEFVEVSAHHDARPEHATWQGKVFHKGGAKDGYPGFESSTGYGTVTGLGGANCRHSFAPFVPGVSERVYSDKELRAMRNPPKVKYGDKYYTPYELSQKQRSMETKLREYKRTYVGFEAAGAVVSKDLQNVAIRYQRLRQEYLSFSRAVGIRPKLERAQVLGYGRSEAAKVVWANRKAEAAKKTSEALAKSDIIVGRSLGAAARNYDVRLPNGMRGKITEGTAITKVKVFAGHGTDVELRVRYYLQQNYGGDAEKWQHVRGEAFVDGTGKNSHIKSSLAEVHWLEEVDTGRVEEMKVVRWKKE